MKRIMETTDRMEGTNLIYRIPGVMDEVWNNDSSTDTATTAKYTSLSFMLYFLDGYLVFFFY